MRGPSVFRLRAHSCRRRLPANVRVSMRMRGVGVFALGAFARMVFQELPSGDIQSVGNALQRVNLYIAAPAFKRVDHLTRKADHQAKACLGKTHLLARTAKVVA